MVSSLRPSTPWTAVWSPPNWPLCRFVFPSAKTIATDPARERPLCSTWSQVDFVVRTIGALEDVDVEQSRISGNLAPRLGERRLARDKISLREILEAGGVEPPSEKPCHQKTTCVARSLAVRSLRTLRSSLAALRAGKKRRRLARWFSPEGHGPRHSSNPTE